MTISMQPFSWDAISRPNQQTPVADTDRGFFPSTIRVITTLSGASYVAKLFERVPSACNQIMEAMGRQPSAYWAAFSAKFAPVTSLMSIIPVTIDQVKKAFGSAIPSSETFAGLDDEEIAVRTAHYQSKHRATQTEAVSLTCYSVSLFAGVLPGSKIANAVKTAAEFTGLSASAQKVVHFVNNIRSGSNMSERVATADGITEEARTGAATLLRDTKRSDMLGIAKEVTYFVGAAAGLWLAFSGQAVLPGVALAVLSTASATFGIWRMIYEEQMQNKPVDCVVQEQNLSAMERGQGFVLCPNSLEA